MIYTAKIEVPDNCSWQTLEDAKLSAEWHRVIERKDRMKNTDLTDKCGSCKYFTLKPDINSCCYGKCEIGHSGYKTRAYPKCKKYERRENCTD